MSEVLKTDLPDFNTAKAAHDSQAQVVADLKDKFVSAQKAVENLDAISRQLDAAKSQLTTAKALGKIDGAPIDTSALEANVASLEASFADLVGQYPKEQVSILAGRLGEAQALLESRKEVAVDAALSDLEAEFYAEMDNHRELLARLGESSLNLRRIAVTARQIGHARADAERINARVDNVVYALDIRVPGSPLEELPWIKKAKGLGMSGVDTSDLLAKYSLNS